MTEHLAGFAAPSDVLDDKERLLHATWHEYALVYLDVRRRAAEEAQEEAFASREKLELAIDELNAAITLAEDAARLRARSR